MFVGKAISEVQKWKSKKAKFCFHFFHETSKGDAATVKHSFAAAVSVQKKKKSQALLYEN